MKRKSRIIALALVALLCLSCERNAERNRVNSMMRDLRQSALTAYSDGLLNYAADTAFPRVYGVIMEYVVDGEIISVIAFKDGGASLYTTSGFGIIGGGEHETIRIAAREFVLAAHEYVDKAVAAERYPYPRRGRMQFYLLTYQGVRVLRGMRDAFVAQNHSLYLAGEEVLTWIRLLTEERISVDSRRD